MTSSRPPSQALQCLFMFLLTAVCTFTAGASDAPMEAGTRKNDGIRPEILVLPAAWERQIPPRGRVNTPEWFTVLQPGRKVSLGLLAGGPGRATAFAGVRIDVAIFVASKEVATMKGLEPSTVRPLKAQGADAALAALSAAGIGAEEKAKLEAAVSLVELAVFPVDWLVPNANRETEVTIDVRISGGVGPESIPALRTRIEPTGSWLGRNPASIQEIGRQMNRHRGDLSAGELLHWLNSVAGSRPFNTPSVHGFFVYAFRHRQDAREALSEHHTLFAGEKQPAVLWMLRLAGLEPRTLLPLLSEEAAAPFKKFAPLADPPLLPEFKDPVELQAAAGVGNTMDLCWAAWMATGDSGYLRLLVNLLQGAPDFPAFQKWQAERGGEKGFNAGVARGMAYQIAGWSIGSFERTDPRVADWLQYWRTDESVPALVRDELKGLHTNPAFRRGDQGRNPKR